MIATPSQYAIAQDRIRRFDEALSSLGAAGASWLRDLQARDIRHQIDVLENDLARYDDLASGMVDAIVVERLADLPRALVQGRIAAGLSQAELARDAGQSLLRIQQWERDGYSRVPVPVMRAIAARLPLTLRGGALADATSAPRSRALRTLVTRAGLPREVYDTVIVPSGFEGAVQDEEIDRRLKCLTGLGAAEFAAQGSFAPVPLRFKLPANANLDRTRAYATYVDGLCAIVASTQTAPAAELPQTWRPMRELLFSDGVIDLKTAVRACWGLGIGVVGLRDKVAFHGTARRVDGRATIVLKPASRHASRWVFDLVHEVFHLVYEEGDFTLLEGDETSRERRQSQDERRANMFAAMVLTNGTLHEAFATVTQRAGGNIARLSSVVPDVARIYRIPVGILANLVAENLTAVSGNNWWGAAENLQPAGEDPWKIVRDVFLEQADLRSLGGTERAILRQISETRDE
ncbi:ImmA/IrrE family metallo-endopeptidase [Methylobacterium sp. E-016]|uniref:XRE family transcriptional regulator n=1 Tax=Methylobacterium sp. E-016 TaxID=2836556 RepID=UPI001FBBFB85|nr:XRE family transcriptional regulator [Methylobacterium sp. E-016]MCJ2075985.1 ImmA/IrrE family metallo-endopeptidase [Methylobacterium sp. E-016]